MHCNEYNAITFEFYDSETLALDLIYTVSDFTEFLKCQQLLFQLRVYISCLLKLAASSKTAIVNKKIYHLCLKPADVKFPNNFSVKKYDRRAKQVVQKFGDILNNSVRAQECHRHTERLMKLH